MTVRVPTIERDVPCWRCGYNLRAQARHGRCPECATAVLESLVHNAKAPRPLREADARRVRVVALSAWLITLGAAGAVAVAVYAWLPDALLPRWLPPLSEPHRVLVWLPVELIIGIGLWGLTWREAGPRLRRPAGDELTRLAARVTGTLASVWAVFLIVWISRRVPWGVPVGLFTVAHLLGAGSSAAGFAHLAVLCGRLRSTALVASCHAIGWSLAFVLSARALEDVLVPQRRYPITAPDPLVGDASLLVATIDRFVPGGTLDGPVQPIAGAIAVLTVAAIVIVPLIAIALTAASVANRVVPGDDRSQDRGC